VGDPQDEAGRHDLRIRWKLFEQTAGATAGESDLVCAHQLGHPAVVDIPTAVELSAAAPMTANGMADGLAAPKISADLPVFEQITASAWILSDSARDLGVDAGGETPARWRHATST
jgi:hypothetical protein